MLESGDRQKRALALSLVVAATLYLSIIFLTGYEAILAAMARLGWHGWLLILSCFFFNYVLRFARWLMYQKRFGYQIPLLLHFHYYISGFSLTTTPAKAGETIRSLYLKAHGVHFHHSLAMFFTERFLDVVAITLLAGLSVLSFAQYGQFNFGAAIMLLLFLPVLRSSFVVHNLQRLTVIIRFNRLRRLVLY